MKTTIVSLKDVIEDFDNNNYFNYRVKRKNKYIVGAKYSLKRHVGITDNITTDNNVIENTYRLCGMAHNINGIPFDGVIMKQLSGVGDNMAFSLSKQQCSVLHIKYQKGLEIFPMSLNFNKLVERFPNTLTFDKSDMASYPHCVIDGTIRYLLIKLDDYKFNKSQTKIKNSINGNTITIKSNGDTDFIPNLIIRSKQCIKTPSKKVIYRCNEDIKYNIVSLKNSECDNYIDNVYVGLILAQNTEGYYTEDGYVGADVNQFTNKTINDIITITI